MFKTNFVHASNILSNVNIHIIIIIMIIICILTLDRIFDAWTKLVLNIFNPEDGRLVRKLGRILENF